MLIINVSEHRAENKLPKMYKTLVPMCLKDKNKIPISNVKIFVEMFGPRLT